MVARPESDSRSCRSGPPRGLERLLARTASLLLFGVSLLLSAPIPLSAQAPTAADRASEIASLLDMATTEYGNAVEGGRVVNEMEYQETRGFLREASRLFAGLREEEATTADERIAAGLDSLRSLVEGTGSRDRFRTLAGELSVALAESRGAVSVPEPARRPDASRGAMLYRQACAACHGATGEGDGRVADGMEPPPTDLTAKLRWQESTPARDYQVVFYGVPETAMPSHRDWLTPEGTWDLVAFLRTLPFDAAEVAEGKALALGGPAGTSPLAGRLRPWSSPVEVARVTDADLARRVRARWSERAAAGRAPADSLEPERARAVVAYLRTLLGTPVEGVPQADRSASIVASLQEADSLAAAAVEVARKGDTEAVSGRALRAYMAFETVEPDLRSRFPDLVREAELAFAHLRDASGAEEAVEARAALHDVLQRAESEVSAPASDWNLATQSFFIMVREGFEAILIIGAILAFLGKTGNEERKRDVHLGTGAAIAASAAAAFLLQEVLSVTPASRELLEGATMLLAVAVLFSCSYWLISKLEHAKWEAYLRAKMKSALGTGGGLALAGVAFLAVFREGVETVIFYQALLGFAEGSVLPVAGGFVAGCVALAVIYLLFTRYGVRIPMRPFFAATSAVLYYMAVVFAGSGMHALQEAGIVGATTVGGLPRVELLGLYPTVETLAAQGVLVVLLGAALLYTFGPSLAAGGSSETERDGRGGRSSVERPRQEEARARSG